MEKFYLMIYFYSKGLSLIFYVCDIHTQTHIGKITKKKANENPKRRGPESIQQYNVKTAYLRIAHKTGTRSEQQQQQQQRKK